MPALLHRNRRSYLLKVTSHVSRDLLQNAAYFSTLPKVVAEYVTNAIDSAAPGQAIRCKVTLSPTEVTIADNGSGMSHAELSNFFQMHGENIQRRHSGTGARQVWHWQVRCLWCGE